MTTAAAVSPTRGAWAVRVYGTPAPKGSMKCVGGRGRHQLINNSKGTQQWQDVVAGAAEKLAAATGIDEPLAGPLGLQLTITVTRPKSIKPAARPWPHVRPARVLDGGGDVDKLARCVMDGLEQGRVIKDDAQICELQTMKVYPDADRPDVLERPGAVIRLYRI